MKKDLQDNTVGPWAAKKLDVLEDYLRFYLTALKKQNFELIYIDAFAGSCVSKIRSKDEITEANQFFGEEEDAKAQDEFVIGSPVRALKFDHGFQKHYFFDLDEIRAVTLRNLDKTFTNKKIFVEVGNCNPIIRDLAKTLASSNTRGVAFLDPYGPHLEWTTLEALAETKNFEVIINFPAAMAINRLITKSGTVPEKWSSMLTKCFGTDAWRKIAYDTKVDLFGDVVTTKRGGVSERLLELYRSRLSEIFGFVAVPRLIRNTRNAPLYYLLWAGPNKLGLKGADHILAQGEKIK
jgi:three-Cys-motif partner protein